MPTLKYISVDDDLKFLFYYFDRTTQFCKSDKLSYDSIEDLDAILERLFSLAGEECNPSKIAEFKKIRKTPKTAIKVPKEEKPTVLALLNYINLVKEAIVSPSLKNKAYIDEFTQQLDKTLKFDPEFYLLEIRSGLIKEIDNAEGMDSLYCEKVMANKEYFICSGLRAACKKEDLVNNRYLFLLNIKKAKFKNLESEGMICCATGSEDGIIEPIQVTKPEGSRIHLEGHLELFEDIEYGKVDFSKGSYKTCFSHFKVIGNHLTFKGIKVTCGGEGVATKTVEGRVS